MDINFGNWLYSVCGTVVLFFAWLFVIAWIAQLATFFGPQDPAAPNEDDIL